MLLPSPTLLNRTMTIPDDACALTVQAAGCAAAWVLEDEEEAYASSRAGRIAKPRRQRSVHEIYISLGDTYFRHAYCMSYP